MTRRGAALFALMSVVWGIPYLLIKVAVRDLSPAVIVEFRTAIGAAVLMPLAVRQGQIRPLLRHWKPFTGYLVAELAVPWFLLSTAERRLPSSLTGLLVATVPLIALVLSMATGGHEGRTAPRDLAGLLLGLVGVGVLLGLDVSGGEVGSAALVLVVAVGYATGPLVASRYLGGLSSLALAAVSLAVVAGLYLPVAAVQLPRRLPPATVIVSIVVLGIVCTAVAFVAFFELIKEMPPTKATLITYFNPMVAVVLGVIALGEPLTVATVIGFALILGGSWLSRPTSGTSLGGQPTPPDPERSPPPRI